MIACFHWIFFWWEETRSKNVWSLQKRLIKAHKYVISPLKQRSIVYLKNVFVVFNQEIIFDTKIVYNALLGTWLCLHHIAWRSSGDNQSSIPNNVTWKTQFYQGILANCLLWLEAENCTAKSSWIHRKNIFGAGRDRSRVPSHASQTLFHLAIKAWYFKGQNKLDINS